VSSLRPVVILSFSSSRPEIGRVNPFLFSPLVLCASLVENPYRHRSSNLPSCTGLTKASSLPPFFLSSSFIFNEKSQHSCCRALHLYFVSLFPANGKVAKHFSSRVSRTVDLAVFRSVRTWKFFPKRASIRQLSFPPFSSSVLLFSSWVTPPRNSGSFSSRSILPVRLV